MKPVSLMLTLLNLAALLCTSGVTLAQSSAARISQLSGQVEIRNSGKAAAKPALQLTPVASQNIITTREKSQSEIQIGNNIVQLDPDSELEIIQLDARNLKLNLHYGVVHLNLADAALLPQFELRAGNGRLLMSEPGQVSVDFGPPPGATAIRLLSGLATFENDGRNYTLQTDTELLLRGDTPRISPLTQDRANNRSTERIVQAPVSTVSTRFVQSSQSSGEVTYYESSPSYQTYQSYQTLPSQSSTVITTYSPQYVYRPAIDPFYYYAPFFIGASLAFNYGRFGYPYYPYYRGGPRFGGFRGSNVGPAGPVNLRATGTGRR